MKEIKIDIPEGYEIDKENSTFECIKFKPSKKYITYEEISDKLFKGHCMSFIDSYGNIRASISESIYTNPNIAPLSIQLKRLLALNQLLNIAYYYNNLHDGEDKIYYEINYNRVVDKYRVQITSKDIVWGGDVRFNTCEDAQAIIDNPNFRGILDTIYK